MLPGRVSVSGGGVICRRKVQPRDGGTLQRRRYQESQWLSPGDDMEGVGEPRNDGQGERTGAW